MTGISWGMSSLQSARHAVSTTISRGSSRSIRPIVQLGCKGTSRRQMCSGTPLQRQALGRITPKRIAVRMPAGEGLPVRSIWRPIVFCLGFGGGAYILAAAYTNADTDSWTRKLGGGSSSLWGRSVGAPSDKDIARAKQMEGAKQAQQTLNHLPETLSFLPRIIMVPILRVYITAKEYTLNNHPASSVPVQLAVGMGTVFLAWKVKRWEPFMRQWFLHRPVLFGGGVRAEWRNCVTMFTSTISHQTLAHYFFNAFALTSFGSAASLYLSHPSSTSGLTTSTPTSSSSSGITTSTHTPHFLAFLLLGGLASSLSSHLYTNIIRLPRLLRSLASPARLSSPSALAAQHGILPSLGASGAIYSALVVTALAMPDSKVGIIFIPFVSFPIWAGVGGMVLVDIVGLIRGWRMLDHVAHLGGAVFGLVYYGYGRQAWIWVRKQLGAKPGGAGIY